MFGSDAGASDVTALQGKVRKPESACPEGNAGLERPK